MGVLYRGVSYKWVFCTEVCHCVHLQQKLCFILGLRQDFSDNLVNSYQIARRHVPAANNLIPTAISYLNLSDFTCSGSVILVRINSQSAIYMLHRN
jgi:hypothetical protein